MSDCNHDCSSCSANCSERKAESFQKPLNPYSSVKKVIAVVSGKGGVGKSLVTSLMAAEMQRRGHRCAVLDATSQALRFLNPSASTSMPPVRMST